MGDLTATDPFAGIPLPMELGASRIDALPAPRILSIAPYPGQEAETARRLGSFPAPGEVLGIGGARLVWAGRGVAFLFDPDGAQAGALADLAAVTDQSDGWAGLRLSGADAQEVLARLVPLDLSQMPRQASARSLLNHMPLLMIREGDAFELWSYRSMAGTLVHEVEAAMRGVAARRDMA